MKNTFHFLKIWLLTLLILSGCQSKQELSIQSVTVDNREDASGVNPENFFFSWKLSTPYRNVVQTSYQIIVASSNDFANENVVWNSGKVNSDQSILLKYTGPKLLPGQTYFYKVKVEDSKENESDWKTGKFTTGLFVEKDWKGAKWIAMDKLNPENRLVPGIHLPGKEYRGKELGLHKLPLVRKEFVVKKDALQSFNPPNTKTDWVLLIRK